jgi:DNA-binding transcriptional ArsR family regulator
MATELLHHIDFEKLDRAAEILKTISHPVRLEIIELLASHEPLSVLDMQERLRSTVEQSMLSHHLIKMRDKGLLACENRGAHRYYRLADHSFLKMFDCLAQCSLL